MQIAQLNEVQGPVRWVTGIAGVNSNYELAVKFLGHAATSGEQDPSVTHGHRPAADATGGGDEKADKERT